jgi:GDP-L-fucose synthase
MKALITGASGFLGKFLSQELKSRKVQVTDLNSKNGNLKIQGSLDYLPSNEFTHIFHLAAWTQAGDFCLKHPGEQWIINQQMNTNLLYYWQTKQPQAKLISMGTSCSYDENLSHSEENYLLGTPISSLYTYAMTKRMLHVGQMAISKQFKLKYLTVVPSTLYGPDYHNDGRQMHFIFDLMRKILRGKKYGEDVVLWGDGSQKREVIFVEDFVRDLLSLEPILENGIVNIGAGEEFTIKYFAETISQIVGYDHAKIKYDITKYVGAKSKCLKISKLESLLGKLERVPLKSGLDKMYNWFEENSAY